MISINEKYELTPDELQYYRTNYLTQSIENLAIRALRHKENIINHVMTFRFGESWFRDPRIIGHLSCDIQSGFETYKFQDEELVVFSSLQPSQQGFIIEYSFEYNILIDIPKPRNDYKA